MGADFKSQMQFIDVDLENCLNELFQFRRLEGRGDMEIVLDATGNSVLALTRTMNGSAKLTGRQGAMVGLNVGAAAAAAGAAAAVRHRRFPQRPHAVREAPGRHQDRAGCRDRRECPAWRAPRCGWGSAARPRSRRAISTCAAWRRSASTGAADATPAFESALRGAGPVGGPDHPARHREPHSALAARQPAARGDQEPRQLEGHGARRARAADPRRAGRPRRPAPPSRPSAKSRRRPACSAVRAPRKAGFRQV